MSLPQDFLQNSILPDADEAEVKLDLAGLDAKQAVKKLLKALKDCEAGSAGSLLVRFEAASENSGPTLFQPIGQELRAAKKQGRVKQCYPVLDDISAGFFVVFEIE